MKRFVIVVLFTLAMLPAHAEPVAKLANVNQGTIYLTFEPCPAKFNVPIADPLYRAYAVDFEGTDHERTVEAYWVSPEINWSEIPEADRPHIVRAITILAPEGHETYLWTDFEPVNSSAKGEF